MEVFMTTKKQLLLIVTAMVTMQGSTFPMFKGASARLSSAWNVTCTNAKAFASGVKASVSTKAQALGNVMTRDDAAKLLTNAKKAIVKNTQALVTAVKNNKKTAAIVAGATVATAIVYFGYKKWKRNKPESNGTENDEAIARALQE